MRSTCTLLYICGCENDYKSDLIGNLSGRVVALSAQVMLLVVWPASDTVTIREVEGSLKNTNLQNCHHAVNHVSAPHVSAII